LIATRTAEDPVRDRLVREASDLAGRVRFGLLDPRDRRLSLSADATVGLFWRVDRVLVTGRCAN
jgi:hypothetical protein